MNRSAYIFFLLAAALLASCRQEELLPEPRGEIREVSWQEAVGLVNAGKVHTVIQGHDLSVRLVLSDRSYVDTTEPSIDDIFRAVESCGAKCRKILVLTE